MTKNIKNEIAELLSANCTIDNTTIYNSFEELASDIIALFSEKELKLYQIEFFKNGELGELHNDHTNLTYSKAIEVMNDIYQITLDEHDIDLDIIERFRDGDENIENTQAHLLDYFKAYSHDTLDYFNYDTNNFKIIEIR